MSVWGRARGQPKREQISSAAAKWSLVTVSHGKRNGSSLKTAMDMRSQCPIVFQMLTKRVKLSRENRLLPRFLNLMTLCRRLSDLADTLQRGRACGASNTRTCVLPRRTDECPRGEGGPAGREGLSFI